MEFCVAKNCKNDSETLQKLQNGKNLCKLTKVLDFDRLQGKVPEPLRPRKLGQLPAKRGAFLRGLCLQESLLTQWGGDERSEVGGAFAPCRQRSSPQKLPAAEHRGQGKQNVKFYSVTSPEISLIADTVAARFCMSLGTISLVALPSATFSMASMLRRAR